MIDCSGWEAAVEGSRAWLAPEALLLIPYPLQALRDRVPGQILLKAVSRQGPTIS